MELKRRGRISCFCGKRDQADMCTRELTYKHRSLCTSNCTRSKSLQHARLISLREREGVFLLFCLSCLHAFSYYYLFVPSCFNFTLIFSVSLPPLTLYNILYIVYLSFYFFCLRTPVFITRPCNYYPAISGAKLKSEMPLSSFQTRAALCRTIRFIPGDLSAARGASHNLTAENVSTAGGGHVRFCNICV